MDTVVSGSTWCCEVDVKAEEMVVETDCAVNVMSEAPEPIMMDPREVRREGKEEEEREGGGGWIVMDVSVMAKIRCRRMNPSTGIRRPAQREYRA